MDCSPGRGASLEILPSNPKHKAQTAASRVHFVQFPSSGWSLCFFITIASFVISSWSEEFLQAQEYIALSSLVLMSLLLIGKWQCSGWLSSLLSNRQRTFSLSQCYGQGGCHCFKLFWFTRTFFTMTLMILCKMEIHHLPPHKTVFVSPTVTLN